MICTVERNHNSIKKHSWTKANCSIELQKNGTHLVLVVKRPGFEFALSLDQNLKAFQTKDGGYSFRSSHCDSLIKFRPENEALGDFMNQIQVHVLADLKEFPDKAKIIENTTISANSNCRMIDITPKKIDSMPKRKIESAEVPRRRSQKGQYVTPISYKSTSKKIQYTQVDDSMMYSKPSQYQINLQNTLLNSIQSRPPIHPNSTPSSPYVSPRGPYPKTPLKEIYLNDESPEGFRNIGQTCYMAAILQLIISSSLNNKIIAATPIISKENDTELFMMFADLMQKNSKKERFGLEGLKKLIGKKAKRFGKFEQEDAHEFLMACMDQLSFNTIIPKDRLKELDDILLKDKQKGSETMLSKDNNELKEIDPISEILLTVKHTLKCKCCDFESSHLEFYNDVSLNLPEIGKENDLWKDADNVFSESGVQKAEFVDLSDEDIENTKINLTLDLIDVDNLIESKDKSPCETYPNTSLSPKKDLSIEHLLNDFFNPESVEYKCPKCLSLSFTLLKNITQAPKTLLLHIKRFSNSTKRTDKVGILKIITVDNCWYKLKGVVSHLGRSMRRGHYIFDRWDGKFWTRFDDSTVTRGLKDLDCKMNSYIVMYEML